MIRYAHAVLIVRGHYCMQLRDNDIPVYPGGWGLFGGSIEPGESSLQALIRELWEELEIRAEPRDVTLLRDFRACRFFEYDATEQWHRHVLHEGRGAVLFTLDELLQLPLNEATYAAILAHRGMLEHYESLYVGRP